MTTSNIEERLRQRLVNFRNALLRMQNACDQDELSELELTGLIGIFTFTFEQGWEALKLELLHQGIVVKTPHATIRSGFEAGYLKEDNCEILLDAMNKRNTMSHMYDAGQAEELEGVIKEKYFPALQYLLNTLEQQ